MNILITGGTGFIGSALCDHLLAKQHTVTVVSRKTVHKRTDIGFVQQIKDLDTESSFDVVINLAGEPIADKRWSVKQKQTILSSRLDTTKAIIAYLQTAKTQPKLLISASAIGFYGIEPSSAAVTDPIDETGSSDESFASQVCREWEETALQAEELGIRTCLLRIGIVLGPKGGALKKMLPPFKLGLGGKIGDGSQWMPWIHRDDLISIMDFCIQEETLSGPINCTAPNPVTNLEFSKALGKALNRPTVIPMPAVVIKTLMGQMGEELLLSGKKVVPQKLADAGFQFEYEQVLRALQNAVK